MTSSVRSITKQRAGSGGSSLEQIIAAIPAAVNFDELRPVLAALLLETERVIGARPLTLEEADRIADLLTDIRVLLKQAAHGKNRLNAEELLRRFDELEGAAKELRNDLGRAAGRACRARGGA